MEALSLICGGLGLHFDGFFKLNRQLGISLLHYWILIYISNCQMPNGHGRTEANAVRMLALSKDHVQDGMAANLKDFVLSNGEEAEFVGSEMEHMRTETLSQESYKLLVLRITRLYKRTETVSQESCLFNIPIILLQRNEI
ncbi:hypothetical protein L1987_39285 [Smallanthus sonchifolius]|uniref:Uncharacterized protein n=1 Tax=Smallanthus sonchifolius TaxID=185202 RepID=A0ACB9HLW7_9ASTR|nr:hypothetical protein L1987_39285 [Smallanthus sonchifolius]